ncbi:c-type cytochrome [Olivibacter domesticus]|uniref:Glucose/arabinose dehydrogenase, beta-propeller fold n=1 Tax=Olivibacter domesticus TaxID=407022 RepID=A0A1H7WU49_OLID1|nr:c-type cytochrome [Olivibacter domesticus]SEM25033.1 Glucose/arabinose dehydrogenase, beta-propeller fold [Olivibacter domesticus]
MNIIPQLLHLRFIRKINLILIICFGLAGCYSRPQLPEGDRDNGGLYLPGGFEALVAVDSLGGGPMPETQQNPWAGRRPSSDGKQPKPFRSNQGKPRIGQPQRNYFGSRSIDVNNQGDVYVKLRVSTPNGKANAALRDTDGDGKLDSIVYWGEYQSGQYGNAMNIHNGYIYYSSELYVFRSKLIPGTLLPEAKIDTIVIDDGPPHEHITKPLAFDGKGHMFVGWGAGSNSCQEFNRVSGSKGMGDPDDAENGCPLLDDHGGIWMFDEDKLNQHQGDGVKYATGLRSLVAMNWDNASNSLYTVMHGTDDFALTWPEYYDYWQGAMLPSEEFFKVPQGFDAGWPYYYYDHMQKKKLLAPEYGGDGKKAGNGATAGQPLVGFPGHFAPNGLLFYKGDQFPARYRNGAFIAFHGSTNRPPYPQAGYIVAFVPMKDGVVTGSWEIFADGFGGMDTIPTAPDANYRPMGLAEGSDGSLYVGDTQKGKIWRIMFKGNKNTFGKQQLAGMEKRKQTASNIKAPDREKDNLENALAATNSAVYATYCRACHQSNGMGDGSRFPPLAESEWVNGDKTKLAELVLNGLSGPITVKGVSYNEVMPAHGSFLNDEQIAQVLTYIRQNFGNQSDAVTAAEVAKTRAK